MIRATTFELACCLLVTAAGLFYVFYLPGKLFLGPEKTRASFLRERKDAVYENLRDLNFEYKAGKMPDADYQSLKSSLQDEAATLLAEIARLEAKAAPHRRAQIMKGTANFVNSERTLVHPEAGALCPPKDPVHAIPAAPQGVATRLLLSSPPSPPPKP